jgi:phosphatidylserine/phosphatidylglycerophosphate/cardiolipin synthase-like enzyme
MAYQIGCTLVQIKSEAERRLEQALEQLAQERVKVRVLTEAIGGRAA